MGKERNYYNDLDFKHSVPIQIRFDDIDRMGHVNNTVLMSYFDYGKVKYLNSLDPKIAAEERSPIIIVHYETDFYEPVFSHEEIFVQSKIINVGEKSITFVQRIVCNNNVKCICRTVMSGFNHETQHSQAIPGSFKNLVRERETFITDRTDEAKPSSERQHLLLIQPQANGGK